MMKNTNYEALHYAIFFYLLLLPVSYVISTHIPQYVVLKYSKSAFISYGKGPSFKPRKTTPTVIVSYRPTYFIVSFFQ
jgi:hypothetical protein